PLPALLFTILLDAEPRLVFSPLIIGVLLSVAATAAIFILFAPRRLGMRDRIVGALSSCYVNAGILGIPIAAYVLHDAFLVAPVLFVQLLVLAPVGLSALDILSSVGPKSARSWPAPLVTRSVPAARLGLLTGLLPWRVPVIIHEPI